jgi:excisionase family DNA binding protein
MLEEKQSPWMTVSEAAQYLRIQPRTIMSWARQEKIRAYALSGTARKVWRFRQDDLDALPVLNSNPPSVAASRGIAQ